MKKTFLILLFCINNVSSISYRLDLAEYEGGFFSVFNLALGSFEEYEKKQWDGITINFENRGFYYDPNLGDNWWNYYFEDSTIGKPSLDECRFSQAKKNEMSLHASLKMSRSRGYELIQKYIRIKPHIQEKIDSFVKQNFNKCYIIGIHYRGTDKIKEAPDYLQIITSINHVIRHLIENNFDEDAIKIFVATDDQNFLHKMQNQFPKKVVFCEVTRSDNGRAVHYPHDSNAYKKGEEALIDCILLSQCSILFKQESNLSNAATKFNPTIPVIELNPHITNFYISMMDKW